MSDILQLRGAGKSWGAVKALTDGNLSVAQGEVHAVCGDNGAGKSTLIKLISGVERPDYGDILLKGRKVEFASPHEALDAGIATIHQDLGLAPRMTIWQNIFMGSELRRKRLGLPQIDRKAMVAQSRDYLGRLNATLQDMEAEVASLSGGQRQAVAICRALRWNADLIIMDEPTAALGVRETAQVMDLIRQLKANGVSVILISHNMKDVIEIADRVTILRAGRTVMSLPIHGQTPDSLAQLILLGEGAGPAPL